LINADLMKSIIALPLSTQLEPIMFKIQSKSLKAFISTCIVLLLSSGALVFFQTACKPVDLEKDIQIAIDLNIFKTFVSFRFADSETGELIGKTDGTIVKLAFGGRDAKAVVSQTGERLDQHASVLGMISVALNPYDPYKLGSGNSVMFNFTATAPGYSPTKANVVISKTGTQVCIVCMRKTGLADNKPQPYQIKPGEIINGYQPVGFRMYTPGNYFELDFPDSVQFLTATGDTSTGVLNVKTIRYNQLSETATGGSRVMRFSKQGVITSGVLKPQNILSVTLQSGNAIPITNLPGKPINWRFIVSSDLNPGDSLPVWSYDTGQKMWISEGSAIISTEDTTRFASFPLRHFSLYAAGVLTPARVVTGQIDFLFTKPFLTPTFQGNVLITDASTSERIQIIPVTLSSGLSLPVSLDLPPGSTIVLTVQPTNGDYEFSTLPASITILPDQLTFKGALKLTPLKCRLAGTVKAAFPAAFTGYPIPAVVQVLDATSGNTLLSNSVSITSTSFSANISVMVRDNRAVSIRIIPSSLAGDFQSTPALTRQETPCIENGSWSFTLESTTCLVQTSASITITGTLPRQSLPADVQLLRASDRRLIKSMSVNLSQATSAVNITSTVPKNTPVLIVVKPTFANRPFTANPTEVLMNNPCGSSQTASFKVTTQFAQLVGKILFSFDPGLLMDQIPIRVISYTQKKDQLLASQDYTLKRSDPVISIDQFTPVEPLYLKITRATSSARFNPEPYKIYIPDPFTTPENWPVKLNATEMLPVHFQVKVTCPMGEVLPTVQGYYRVPGDDWHEMNIVSGSLTITIELGLTYEVGMIFGGVMIDSIFTVQKQENNLTFPLEKADCEKMGWGK
jgi:hypothetical protein